MAATVRAIYRCLLRDAHKLQRTPHFNIRRDLRLEQWGSGSFVEPLSSQELQMQITSDPIVLTSLKEFRKLRDNAIRLRSPEADIVNSIRLSFRQNAKLNDRKIVNALLDEAIEIVSELSDQLWLARCSSVTVTDGVRIEATSKYVQNYSNTASNVYRFTYRITITNINKNTAVQILGRQYTFESEKGMRIALPRNSAGIVGATPLLEPGQTFEYASGVDIDAPGGSVTGCLHAPHTRTGNVEDLSADIAYAF
ncbi:ApaG domain [Plasmopara halstedii]|uniref:ApaG domain n=1 Tax=Plasmopara halstedii TaxID=4781 RepID=A0A0N7L8C3_PLAHL|nr:ApaG domain [Plasmopara halstedii]CEG49475.1 ApaG domain [Plasmopara halstedii]|eukprot:XP_024585844.1 ApaG domain [Plasmopara halstedii]